jgi:hypothetical protein
MQVLFSFPNIVDIRVGGTRLRLWTAVTKGPIVQPPGYI